MEMSPEQDAVKSAALTIALNTIENDSSEHVLLNMMQRLIAFSDRIIDKAENNDEDPRIECSCGCSYCCHMQVKVTPPECFLIFAYILETFSAQEIERLKQRIDHNRDLTEGRSFHERVLLKRETLCIFLTDHVCDIYHARPLICRAWHSLNRKGCKQAFLSDNSDSEIETAPLRHYVLGMIREAIHDVCVENDWEYDTYELPFALFSCFHHSNPMQNWLKHHHPFEMI